MSTAMLARGVRMGHFHRCHYWLDKVDVARLAGEIARLHSGKYRMARPARSGDVPRNDFARIRRVSSNDMQLLPNYRKFMNRVVSTFSDISQP